MKTDNLIDVASTSNLNARKQCDQDSYLFIQAPCLVPVQQIQIRKIIGLFTGCLGVFIYLFTQVYCQWIKSVEENNYIEWDVQTITAADYTVEFDINPDMFSFF